jgi:hypothetical protein
MKSKDEQLIDSLGCSSVCFLKNKHKKDLSGKGKELFELAEDKIESKMCKC